MLALFYSRQCKRQIRLYAFSRIICAREIVSLNFFEKLNIPVCLFSHPTGRQPMDAFNCLIHLQNFEFYANRCFMIIAMNIIRRVRILPPISVYLKVVLIYNFH